jgi:hypothetical protein
VKKYIFLFALVLISFSCVRTLALYNWQFSLIRPEASEIAKVSPENLSYSDDFIEIKFVFGGVGVVIGAIGIIAESSAIHYV